LQHGRLRRGSPVQAALTEVASRHLVREGNPTMTCSATIR
jgi:hypothetical protein